MPSITIDPTTVTKYIELPIESSDGTGDAVLPKDDTGYVLLDDRDDTALHWRTYVGTFIAEYTALRKGEQCELH